MIAIKKLWFMTRIHTHNLNSSHSCPLNPTNNQIYFLSRTLSDPPDICSFLPSLQSTTLLTAHSTNSNNSSTQY